MKVVIRHYNLTEHKYDAGFFEYREMSIAELKKLLIEIPKEEETKDFPVEIANKQYVFTKKASNEIQFIPNEKSREAIHTFEISDKKDKLMDNIKISDYQRSRFDFLLGNVGNAISFCIIPVINFFTLLFAIFNKNFTFLTIIMLILLGFSILAIYYIINDFIVHYNDPLIKIEPPIPFYDSLETVNGSKLISIFIQLLYIFFFDSYNIEIAFFLVRVLIIGYYYLFSFFLFFLIINDTYTYFIFKKIKNKLLIIIKEKIYFEKGLDKLFYFNLFFKVKKKKLVNFGSVRNIPALLAFLFAIFPVISLMI